MSKELRENLLGFMEIAINRGERLMMGFGDAEDESWVSIVAEQLSEHGIGPEVHNDTQSTVKHYKAIRPYLEVFGVERAQAESKKLRQQGR